MGDTYRDPVDHLRTTRPLAGESLIDVLHWPGYLLIVAGVIGGVGISCGFRTPDIIHRGHGRLASWRLSSRWSDWRGWPVEHRRIRRIADRWYVEHPEVRRQRLAS